MIKGRSYIMESKDFDFEFSYDKTVNDKVISKEGIVICNLKDISKLKVKINEKK